MMGTTYNDIAYETALTEEVNELQDRFGDELTANEATGFSMWVLPLLRQAEALNKSQTRVTICAALSGMPECKIDDRRDDSLPMGLDMLEAIVPPSSHPAWGSYGRPRSLSHQIYRMEGKDKNDKPVDLIKSIRDERDIGDIILGYELTPKGLLYSHIHGLTTKNELVHYWRWQERNGPPPAVENPWYLTMIRGGTLAADGVYQYTTPGAAVWASLEHLGYADPSVPERYREATGARIGRAITDVYTNKPEEAMKFLVKADQKLLIQDILVHAGVANRAVRLKYIDGLYIDRLTYADRHNQLVEVYKEAHPEFSDPDVMARNVVGELVCRAVYLVARQVMDYRMNDDVLSSTPLLKSGAGIRMNSEEVIESLVTMAASERGEVTDWLIENDYVSPEDFFEPDEDIARGR